MFFHLLESGSKGNCTIIGSSDKRYIMIDDGISFKKLKSKLNELNISFDDIKALLITHNHSDHISGIGCFDKEASYCTSLCGVEVPPSNYLIPFEKTEINGFSITCLPTSHDAPGSCGFLIECDGETLVYITDTGYIYEKVCNMICNKEYYVMESNHNVKMQLETNRPEYLKRRILGDEGHLSNVDSAHYMCDVIGNKTKQIILAHLSLEANTPEKALEEYREVFEEREINFDDYDIRCASQEATVSGGKIEVNL